MVARAARDGPAPVRTTVGRARRLNVTKQHLAGARPARARSDAIVDVVREIGYVQWDPVSVVAPSHLLALWNRIDRFRPADLERLLWHERRLFQYFVHAAGLVPVDDYPLFASYMSRYPESLSSGWGSWRARARRWIPAHAALRRRVLRALANGPRRVGDFEEHRAGRRDTGGWGSGSDVSEMLFHLQMRGEVTLVGQDGHQNLWGLTKRFFPQWTGARPMPLEEAEEAAATRAIGALGVATPREIRLYFMRGQYQDLKGALARLVRAGTIRRVAIEGWGPTDERYVLSADVPRLEAMETEDWVPRVSLLPPFDSLTSDRARTAKLFGFDHFTEMYVPAAKRRWGYYVLPILRGETFVGRIDPRFDRARETLVVEAVHAEPGVPRTKELGRDVRDAIDRLAEFLGARRLEFTGRVPSEWSGPLR
ncbi:MAG TPA: crosslink repair DNA glycosylase YcaQ family protein [Thermoplasmata archaeon]|nr:crosslink repair DNA glycosylase YcaQ family protein [Thermoplasmata archaeon]